METIVKSEKKGATSTRKKKSVIKPFVLSFLTYRKGVMSATTTGTINDIDSGDNT